MLCNSMYEFFIPTAHDFSHLMLPCSYGDDLFTMDGQCLGSETHLLNCVQPPANSSQCNSLVRLQCGESPNSLSRIVSNCTALAMIFTSTILVLLLLFYYCCDRSVCKLHNYTVGRTQLLQYPWVCFS